MRPVSLSFGQNRPSWFNISSLPPHPNDFDENGVAESIHAIEQLILEEVQRGIHPRKIFLVGFSQGAALALMVGLTTLHDLGGIGCLSGWIPHRIRHVRAITDLALVSVLMRHCFSKFLRMHLIYPYSGALATRIRRYHFDTH